MEWICLLENALNSVGTRLLAAVNQYYASLNIIFTLIVTLGRNGR